MNGDDAMVQIALPRELLQQLFQTSLLKPKDLLCLDDASKQIVRELCLQSCRPQQCGTCAMQDYCGKTLFRIPEQRIELIADSLKSH